MLFRSATGMIVVSSLCSLFLQSSTGNASCIHSQCGQQTIVLVQHGDTGQYIADERQTTGLSASNASSSLSPEALPRLAEAKTDYRKAVDGDTGARQRAALLLAQLIGEYPDSATIRVYLGSVRLLEARDSWVLWSKYRLSQEGLALLDNAVANAPNDVEVRAIRALTTYHLPARAQRSEQSAGDLQWVALRAATAVTAAQLEPALAATAVYYHGLCRAARHDLAGAHAAWHATLQLAPLSSAARAAAVRLQATTTPVEAE